MVKRLDKWTYKKGKLNNLDVYYIYKNGKKQYFNRLKDEPIYTYDVRQANKIIGSRKRLDYVLFDKNRNSKMKQIVIRDSTILKPEGKKMLLRYKKKKTKFMFDEWSD